MIEKYCGRHFERATIAAPTADVVPQALALDPDLAVVMLSAVNDANDYQGPGTGYRLSGARAAEIADIPQALDPLTVGNLDTARRRLDLQETGPAAAGSDPAEIVIALGPAFGSALDASSQAS